MEKSRSLFVGLILTFLILFLVGYVIKIKTEKLPESGEENKTEATSSETSSAITNMDQEETTIPEEEPVNPEPAEEKPMTRGIVDSDLIVEVYDKNKAMDGTTLLPDNRNSDKPKIIEVNMLGEIIWEYDIPQELKNIQIRALMLS